MIRKTLLIVLAGFACFSSSAWAQAPGEETPADKAKTGETPGPNRFWQATLSGGHFMVALERIASVSRHKYVLDGALIVDEVTVDTVGQALARFYFIAPITDAAPGNSVANLANRGKELLDEAADRAGVSVQDMVHKKLPVTTHAKSIEYRVMTESGLTALYNSVTNAWESGRGRKFSAK